jgi:hypothetical protein
VRISVRVGLLFVIVKSVLSGLQRAGLPKGSPLWRMRWSGLSQSCSALTALGPDRTSKLVFIFQMLRCRAGIVNGSDQVS